MTPEERYAKLQELQEKFKSTIMPAMQKKFTEMQNAQAVQVKKEKWGAFDKSLHDALGKVVTGPKTSSGLSVKGSEPPSSSEISKESFDQPRPTSSVAALNKTFNNKVVSGGTSCSTP